MTTRSQHLFARPIRAAAAALAACMVAACGGGGGGGQGGAATPVVTVPQPTVATVAAGTWVVMGSSTAAGAGASAGNGWANLLQTAMAPHGAQVANIALGGTVTYEGLSAAAPAVANRPKPNPAINIDQALSRKPVLLIVSYPTNDTALGYSVDEAVNNILAIRAQALAAGVPVVVTSTQPRNLSGAQLAQLQAIDQRLVASVGACLVQLNAALAGTDGKPATQYDAGDGVHPNDAGHRVIVMKVQQLLDGGACVRFAT